MKNSTSSRSRRPRRMFVEQLEGIHLLANLIDVFTQSGPSSLAAAVATVDANPQTSYTIDVLVPYLYDTGGPALKVTAGCAFQFNSAVDEAAGPVLDIAAPGQTVSITGLIVAYAPSASAAITIEDYSSVTASDCTLTGAGYGPGSTGNGTALVVTQGSSLTLTNSSIQGFDYGVNVQNAIYNTNNVSYTNDGVSALVNGTGGTVNEEGAYYTGNGSSVSPAIQNSGILRETGSQVIANQGPNGSGVVASYGGQLTLTTATISTSTGLAPAVYAVNGTLVINQGATIQNNLSGALFTENETVSINNGTISSNQTEGDFNVVFDTSTVAITDTTIEGNVQAITGPYDTVSSVVTVSGDYNNFSGNGPEGNNPTGPYYPPTYYPVYPVVPIVANPYPVYPTPIYPSPVSGSSGDNQGGQMSGGGSSSTGHGKHAHQVHVGKNHPGSSSGSRRRAFPLTHRAHAKA